VRVIAGESHGVPGAVQRDGTQPLYLTVHLEAGAAFAQPLPEGHHAFVYVYRGQVTVDGGEAGTTAVPVQRMAVKSDAPGRDGVVLRTAGDAPARALVIAGRPLNEPIAQYGPFVMNTQEEVFQALADFRRGRL
jgi:redox-sensitive bicupin YhaK (pirin superfamily)